MDFGKTPGTIADSSTKRAMLGIAAQAMAADIGQAIATGQLSAVEVAQLWQSKKDVPGRDVL